MNKIDKVGSVSAHSVKKCTKKDWDEWIQILNQQKAQNLTHQKLVELLKVKFKLTPWWQQEVARGYHIAIGIRVPQQTLKGTYTTTVTKSMSVSAKVVFDFIISESGQSIWLKPLYKTKVSENSTFEAEGEIFGVFRGVTKNKKLRLLWIDSDWPRQSVLQIMLYPKPKHITMIVVSHLDLPTLRAKKQMHERWRAAIDEIAASMSNLKI